jgi:hypothetical protein
MIVATLEDEDTEGSNESLKSYIDQLRTVSRRASEASTESSGVR